MKSRPPDNKSKSNSGQACLEFAIILPVLVLLVAGVVDFSCVIRANSIISSMSREGANLASRSQVAPQDIMNALADTAQPLDMKNNGTICITLVQSTGSQAKILSQTAWQNGSIAASSQLGTPTASNPNPTAQNLGALTLTSGQTANVIEVFYNYHSIFSSVVQTPYQLYSRTIF